MIRAQLSRLRPLKPRGRFPSVAWAWPAGPRDLLLQAAILPDLDKAAAAYRQWEATTDFDDVDFPAMRLLVAIAHRIPDSILRATDRPRLTGVERKLWSECVIALRGAEPALAAIEQAGIDIMVFKGAVRSVLDFANLRGRYASELDLLVRPDDYERAWHIVVAAGWEHPRVRPDFGRMSGMNLRRKGAAELDLHKYPYHQLLVSDARPEALWARASAHQFLGHKVFVPSPSDRLLMAIAHGTIGGHEQSDWLVDCALLVSAGNVDWPLFLELARERRVEAHAAIVLSYLAGPMALPVPQGVLDVLVRAARRHPLRLAGALLQGRPKYDHSAFSALGRGIARGLRIVRREQLIGRVEAERRRRAIS